MCQDSPLGDLCALVHLHRTDHRHHHQGRWGFLDGSVENVPGYYVFPKLENLTIFYSSCFYKSNLDLPSGISDQR